MIGHFGDAIKPRRNCPRSRGGTSAIHTARFRCMCPPVPEHWQFSTGVRSRGFTTTRHRYLRGGGGAYSDSQSVNREQFLLHAIAIIGTPHSDEWIAEDAHKSRSVGGTASRPLSTPLRLATRALDCNTEIHFPPAAPSACRAATSTPTGSCARAPARPAMGPPPPPAAARTVPAHTCTRPRDGHKCAHSVVWAARTGNAYAYRTPLRRRTRRPHMRRMPPGAAAAEGAARIHRARRMGRRTRRRPPAQARTCTRSRDA